MSFVLLSPQKNTLKMDPEDGVITFLGTIGTHKPGRHNQPEEHDTDTAVRTS